MYSLGRETMPQVIKVSDTNNLVPTSNYPYAKWPFEHFNPVQSKLIEIFEGNSNVAIAAATSSGKTICSEIYLAYGIRKLGGKGIYVGPLKALAKEKEMDWTDPNHHFSDLKTFIATGDFRFTAKRLQEMEDSSLIVMTPEMLASRCRNHKSDKSKFLYDVNTVVFDESHLLTVPSRGDHIEVALMKLTEINPNVRIVLLSATMPNVDEICGWISQITGRDTFFLESDYRPCPLNIHYESYFDGDRMYDDRETAKIGVACAIAEYYNEDKFLIFAHTKKTGQLLIDSLARYNIKSEFHNADLNLKERMKLEERFKNDKDFRVLVATSTLAWGLNLPARRVIVLGVHRGLTEVENYDIQQMIGRAGRPKYDPRGDAYILIPESNKNEWIKKLKRKSPIRSTILDFVGRAESPHYKTLAFHVVAEIHQGNIKTKEAFKEWFSNSLANYQDHGFNDQIVETTLKSLEECHAISKNYNGEYECTAIGKVASMFYYSPFDVSDLRKNFKKLFEQKKQDNDFAVSLALGNIDSYRFSIINRQEKEAATSYRMQIERMYGTASVTDPIYKIGCTYLNMLQGKRDVPVLQATTGTLMVDLDRTLQVLNALDSMSGKWDQQAWFKILALRLRYGVTADLVELCQIPNIGSVRAKKLKAKRIKNLDEFIQHDADTLSKIMGCSIKLVEEALDGAKAIKLQDSIS